MKGKCILMTIDGMRPDGFLSCGNNFVKEMMARSRYTLRASSVFPPVTLPAHLSIFHSVPPQRHGTMTNDYMPPVHAISGLFEQIKYAGGRSAMFYGWEPIRDIARPKSLRHAEYIWAYSHESSDTVLTERALAHIKEMQPDFVFLYLVETDEKGGHDRTHGMQIPEDMTIPMFFFGKGFLPGEETKDVTLLDLAPTIADVLGIPAAEEWEGRSLLK